ncbi:MAG: thiamine pyrophosphate-dependent enzyme [Candidatus Limnocylindria bacterium]
MPEAPMATLGYKDRLKLQLFPTIWCPGCGIGTIMIMLAQVLDEMGYDETNTILVTGIGCTGRMGGYMKFESVYTLHGRTMPVAEAIKTVRPEMNVIVVAGDGDTASIGGNHLLHTIRRNANITVLCNNNEIYGLTGGQTGPTTPTNTKTLSSPQGNPNTPINLQGIVRSSPHALYAKTTVYHQLHMRNVIKEALEWDGFSFVDITSQCIENNGRRIGFASANEMLTFYRKTYKRAAKDAERLNPFEIGIVYPVGHGAVASNGHAAADGNGKAPTAATSELTSTVERPAALPEQPRAPLQSASDSPGAGGATAAVPGAEPKAARSDDQKARRRAESEARLALMSKLSSEVKLRVAKGDLSLGDALREAAVEIPPEMAGLVGQPATRPDTAAPPPQPGYGPTDVAAERTGASAPPGAPVAAGEVEVSATAADPGTERQPSELRAQKAEAVAEARDMIGGVPGGDPMPALPRTPEDAAPPVVEGSPAQGPADLASTPVPSSAQPASAPTPSDPREAKRAEAQKKLALMSKLSSEVKLRVAKGEIALADALREAGIDPSELG